MLIKFIILFRTWFMNKKDKRELSKKMKSDFEKNRIENVLMDGE